MKRVLVLLLFACAPLAAHEIGTSRVDVELRRGTYRVDVTTAPQSLLNKLEARTRRPRSSGLSPAQLQMRLQALAPEIAKAADIRFGASRSAPRVTVLPVTGEPATVVIRLTGDTLAGAFTWGFDLIYVKYALTINGNPPVWLDSDERSSPAPVPPNYLVLGFTHIVPYGLDHILFVVGMFLLTPRIRPVLMQVTAFTVAHSITLALTMLGLVSLSPRIVEPLIALSIAWVAVENLTTTKLRRARVAIVFAFGLLHGMGFAGVLSESGLPRADFLPALLGFNVGVELGQLAVIATAYLLLVSWAERREWYRPRVVVPASVAIACAGAFWLVERLS